MPVVWHFVLTLTLIKLNLFLQKWPLNQRRKDWDKTGLAKVTISSDLLYIVYLWLFQFQQMCFEKANTINQYKE